MFRQSSASAHRPLGDEDGVFVPSSSSSSSSSSSWPASLSFPLLDRTMTSYSSDTSSVISSSSAEADTSPSVDVESAARYFNNLRIASSDDDEPPGTPPSAIFRSQWSSPSSAPATNQHNNYSIIRSSSSNSTSSRLPIRFRPSREFDDDNIAATTTIRPMQDNTNAPFDPYGEDPTSAATTTSDNTPEPVAFFPLFPSQSEDTTFAASSPSSVYDDPPLEISHSSPPCTPKPQVAPRYNESYPATRSHLSTTTTTKTSTQGVLAVQGAGIPSVNGAYKRTGRFDRVGMYTKKSTHRGRPITFTIFRCVASDFSRKWYLSIVSSNANTGASMPCTSNDVDLYTAPSIGGAGTEELPPEDGWKTVSGSGLEGTLTPHTLWIPMHNKKAGKTSAQCSNCSSTKRTQSSTTAQEETTKRKIAQCCVCMDEKVSHVFVPCGHAAICKGCSKQWKAKLTNGWRRQCPIGRCKVKGVIKLYGTVVEDD